MIDRNYFFTEYRKRVAPKFTTKQYEGFEASFKEWDLWVSRKWTDNDLRKLAYILATDWHEGDKTMQPIKEYGTNVYFVSKYWNNKKLAKELGNLSANDAVNYCGKGKPQLTGRANYARMGKILGYDLVKNPDLMLTMKVATEVMFEGMMSGRSFRGDFTGKQLSNYFNATTCDPFNARRIINGIDKAKQIEEYYDMFLPCLKNAA